MLNARTFLSDEQQGKAAYAITEAERKTGAEILVAIATESGRYDRAESLCGLFFALLSLSLVHVGIQSSQDVGSWTSTAAGIGIQSTAVSLGFVFGMVLASYVHPIRRLFTSREEMEQEAIRGARQVFMNSHLHGRRHRGGILIYLSLFEHRLVVLPDAAVRDCVGADEDIAAAVVAEAQAHLRARKRFEAIVAAVQMLGDKLSTKFPNTAPDEENEYPNHLALIHPRP
jgi:putative membrane protein